jgi:hypothetical protein
MRAHYVRALLMGGQACVFYGGAEFSRDIDLAVLAEAGNLARLRRALLELAAEPVAVPSLALRHLRTGHAVHFRCMAPGAGRLRVDVMSRMRGVDGFPKLWKRRTVLKLPDGTRYDLVSLPDLVRAKKTQRDKDWPMIRRLVEAHFFRHRGSPNRAQVRFWLLELRTPELLLEVAQRFPGVCRRLCRQRPLLAQAASKRLAGVAEALRAEEALERLRDRDYWAPLKRELETMRHARARTARSARKPRSHASGRAKASGE